MSALNPQYDFIGAIDTLAPGVVLQREIMDATMIAINHNGGGILSQAQLLAGLQVAPPEVNTGHVYLETVGVTFPVTPPAYPTGLPRFEDSNPDLDGWALDQLTARGGA
jgi:hypothetical protein